MTLQHRREISDLIDRAVYTYDGIKRHKETDKHLKKLADYKFKSPMMIIEFEEMIKEILTEKLQSTYGIRNFIENLRDF